MILRAILHLIVFLLLSLIFNATGTLQRYCIAQDSADESEPPVFDFSDNVQLSTADEGLPWIESIVASHYGGSMSNAWGAYGNRLRPTEVYFVALPANFDGTECLGGHLGCKISRCGNAQPTLDEMLESPGVMPNNNMDGFAFWPGADMDDTIYDWVIEGTEGDGLFRVLEIRPAGCDGSVIEAYVGDVGPWNQYDPYWATGTRPDAEDGIDTRGRRTNRAGVDCSWALAQALGFTGLMEVDWRWKTIDGAFVVRRQPTDWFW